MMEQAAAVAIGLFMAGVIYQAGRLTARVEKLEEWRNEILSKLERIDAGLLRLEHLITGEER